MTHPTSSTSATGGSANSQADSLDERSWRPRLAISATVRLLSLVIPAGVSFVAVWAAMVLVPQPATWGAIVPWLGLLVAVAFAAMHVAGFATRRLAPISALFQMSLVFPDAAPSRFQTALRSHTGRQLGKEAAIPTSFASHQAAAEHLVSLMARLSAHDRRTRGHSERVRAYSVMLGDEINLPADSLEKLNWASLAHDIGKLQVPDSVLNKSGRPTDDEWLVLKNHPGAAEKYIRALRPWLGDWIDCATQHHERMDGKGYPDGLSGDQISLAGRIVSIADAYDVMTAARSYKRPLPPAQARAELIRNSGTQFDPVLVRAFLEISIPRRRWVGGWLGWLAHLPNMLRLPVIPAAQTVGGAVAAGTVAAAAIIAAPLTELPPDEIPFTVERNVDDPVDALGPPPGEPDDSPDSVSDNDATTTTTLAFEKTPSTTVGTGPSTPSTTTTSDPSDPTASTTVAPSIPPPTTSTGSPTTTIGGSPTTSLPVGTTTTTTAGTGTTSTTTTSTTTTTTTTTTAAPAVTTANDDTSVILLAAGRDIQVLVNDDFGTSSANVSSLTVTSAPSRGTTSINGAIVHYTPGFLQIGGTDTFTYRICSVAGSCDTAVVTVFLTL